MTTITEALNADRSRPLVLCDFSPPRGADLIPLREAAHVGADFVSVAYNPGKSVRTDSAMTAAKLHTLGCQVVFNLACRDMNKLSIQSHLMGAHLLGLENMVVVQGDRFTEQELGRVKEVNDFRPTELIRSIKELNEGVDYRGLRLRKRTGFCVGATLDPSRDLSVEVRLARRKVEAGAEFFLSQVCFDPARIQAFHQEYERAAREPFPKPIFYGLQLLEPDGLFFGDVPDRLRQDLEKGRSGLDIALECFHALQERGISHIYLVPVIMRGGRRDYAGAREALEAFSRGRRAGETPAAREG